jgi:hypothetical protein
VFRGHFRRSGSLRSVWHRRERKRRPAGMTLNGPVAQLHSVPLARKTPTEANWQSGDPRTMIRCVARLATDRGIVFHMTPRAVERKLRLFYCACCRLRWGQLPVAAQAAVEVAEQRANGRVNSRCLRVARRDAQAAERYTWPVYTSGGYAPGAWDATHCTRLAITATEVHARLRTESLPDGSPVNAADQVVLLRDLFQHPFHPIPIEQAWLTPTVLTLAHVIQAERTFELIPVLGDALQDAGCDSVEVLDHCYGPGPHAAGCWLVDRLSGWGIEGYF